MAAKIIVTELKSPLTASAKSALLSQVHGTFLYLPDDNEIIFKAGHLYKLGNRIVKCARVINGEALFHSYSIIRD